MVDFKNLNQKIDNDNFFLFKFQVFNYMTTIMLFCLDMYTDTSGANPEDSNKTKLQGNIAKLPFFYYIRSLKLNITNLHLRKRVLKMM